MVPLAVSGKFFDSGDAIAAGQKISFAAKVEFAPVPYSY